MTAEGTACNGAGEAPKAEFAAEKVAAAAPAEERAPGEREGEEVGGPFVIVNGDSDGLSDRGSDLGKAPDEDSRSHSEEEQEVDAPGSNAAPEAAVSGDHEAAGGEASAPDAALDASSAGGRDRAAAETEGSADVVHEVVQQETAGGDKDVEDALVASGSDRAVTGADSAATAVDSEIADVESTREDSAPADGVELMAQETASVEHNGTDAAADGAELVVRETASAEEAAAASDDLDLSVQESASAEQNGTNAAAESSEQDDALTYTESGSAVKECDVCGDKEEQSAAAVLEPVDQSSGGAGTWTVNGHPCTDTRADSFEAATQPKGHTEESKVEHNATEVTELVEQDAASREQDHVDAMPANGHIYVARSPDSCASASELKDRASENKGQESDQQELGTLMATEVEVSEGVLEADARNYGAGSGEEPVEAGVDSNGHSYSEGSAEASGEPELVIEEVESEITFGTPQSEEKMDKDGEGTLSDDCTAVVASSDQEVKPPMKEGINEAVQDVSELGQVTGNTSQKIVLGGGLVQEGVSVAIPHSVEPESDPSVESSREQKCQVEVAAGDETAESHLKADNVVVANTADKVHTPHVNSACEVDETEVKRLSFADESNSALQNCDSAVETQVHEELETSGVSLTNEIENDAPDAELKKESDMEVVDAVPLQATAASAASTFCNDSTPIDLADTDSFKHPSPGTELEYCDSLHTEKSRSLEISNIEQVVSGDSLEHGTAVGDESELTSETAVESQEKTSAAAIDQGVPFALNEDEPVVVDDAQLSSASGGESAVVDEDEKISKKDESVDIFGNSKSHENQPQICNASTMCDDRSSRIGNEGSLPVNEVAFPIEEPCPSDETCKDTFSENVNASVKSSNGVEMKYLEEPEPSSADTVVPEEHNAGDDQACGEEPKTVDGSSELHVNSENGNMGDAHVIMQDRFYIIKIPKFAGEDLWAKAQEAEARLDQLTRERDAINIRKQKQRAVCDEYYQKLEVARQELTKARAAHGDKKHDLNSVRSMIGKLNQANSIEEIDEMIAMKENIMQHETIPLKEEKLLIKEINELKAQRKQLCSNMGSKAEINEAFHQKDHIHERHKTLKKDSDELFTNLKSLEENKRKIQKSYDDEKAVLKKLNEEYRAANDIRQKAYRDWSEMKAAPRKKNAYFLMYRQDRIAAEEYAASGDMYGLQTHCNKQMERVMEMWNKDEDFRKQYVEANKVSTLRRLGTHDGRRLGPDEEPPVIPVRRPINRSSNPSQFTYTSPDVPISTSVEAPVEPATVSVTVEKDSFPVLPSPHISKRAKSKAPGSSAQNETTTVAVPEREDVKQTEKEKARLMEEELELARKAEELAQREAELREERAAAEKERLRLEQKAKAKEAEERKKRKAEKAQERAEFKARKEAEMKEKKKAKKDKKKGPSDTASGSGDSNAADTATVDGDKNTSQNPRDTDGPQHMAPRRISRPAAVMKQLNRVEPMPLPLRNRGKRKMRQYIMVAVAVLSVLALFMAGNYIPQLKSLHF
ncbi:hypothetical protein ACP70R_007083 [Stipagrostis hirtigluma subsp. patula]